jgi:hypothetical protein
MAYEVVCAAEGSGGADLGVALGRRISSSVSGQLSSG